MAATGALTLRLLAAADIDHAMVVLNARLDQNGGLAIPAELRRATGFEPGSEVVLEAAGGEIRIRHADAALRRVQEKYRQLAQGRRVVDELLTERRKGATHDEGDR